MSHYIFPGLHIILKDRAYFEYYERILGAIYKANPGEGFKIVNLKITQHSNTRPIYELSNYNPVHISYGPPDIYYSALLSPYTSGELVTSDMNINWEVDWFKYIPKNLAEKMMDSEKSYIINNIFCSMLYNKRSQQDLNKTVTDFLMGESCV